MAGTRMGVTLVQEARRELAARQTTPVRAVFGLLMLAAVCWFVLGVPWPRYVRGPVTLQPAELVPVFVPIAGRIVKKAEIDQEVHPGDLLAQLENPELRSEIETLRSRVVAQKLAVEALQKRRNEDPAAAAELPTAQQLAEELESQLQSREENAARLKIVSPQTGRLFPALRQPSVPPEEETLPLWEDHPLANMNRASWLGEGTLLCWVGREERWLANLFISQSEIERVRIDQPVDLLLSQSRGETLHGKVIRIAESHVSPPAPGEPAPHPLPESLNSFADASGQRKLSDTVFQVTVELTDRPKLPYRFRSRGQARILTGQASLGERLWQEWQRTVKFRL